MRRLLYITLADKESGLDPYDPVDAAPEPQTEDEKKSKTKKIVRYYDGINPEVEAELQKVIDELHEKGVDNNVSKTE